MASTDDEGKLESRDSLIARENDDGKTHARSITDICCLLIFVIYFCGMGHIYMVSQEKGNLRKLTSGFDWAGHICGVRGDVQDKPNLFWCAKSLGGNSLTLTDGMCVSECPDSAALQWCPDDPVFTDPQPQRQADGTEVVQLGLTRTLRQIPGYKTAKIPGLGFCFPDPTDSNYEVIMQLIANHTELGQNGRGMMNMAHGVVESWRFLLACLVFAVILGYAFIYLMKKTIKPFVYGLMILLVLMVFALGGALLSSAWMPQYNVFNQLTTDPDEAKLYAQIAGGIVLVLAIPVVCLVSAAKRAIEVTVQCIMESCDILVAMPTLLFEPITQIVFKGTAFVFLMYGLLWAISMGDVRPGTSMDIFDPEGWQSVSASASGFSRSISLDQDEMIMVLYWIFGMLWLFETITAAGQYALSHAVVMFKYKGHAHCLPLLRGYFNAFVFHLGTLAFGAFIIGVLKFVTMILTFLAKQMRNADGSENMTVKCCTCCCIACLQCITNLMEYLNMMAYTECCIHGTGFLSSSSSAYARIAKNPIAFGVVKGTSSVVNVLGIGVISILGTYVAYQIQFHDWTDQIVSAAGQAMQTAGLDSNTGMVTGGIATVMASQSAIGSTIAAFLIFFYVSQCFMEVFTHTSNCLAYVIIWLQESSGGDKDHPNPKSWEMAQQQADAGKEGYVELG